MIIAISICSLLGLLICIHYLEKAQWAVKVWKGKVGDCERDLVYEQEAFDRLTVKMNEVAKEKDELESLLLKETDKTEKQEARIKYLSSSVDRLANELDREQIKASNVIKYLGGVQETVEGEEVESVVMPCSSGDV